MSTTQKPSSPQPRPPLWKQFSNFTNAHPMGIDKTLRLIQAVCMILSSSVFISYIPNSAYAVKCASAKSQLALARRYLRFFKFVDAFEAGYSAWQAPAPLESDAVKKLAAIGKWSFLGVYLLLEDFTILDAMGIWVTPWAKELFLESQKWWFYSFLLSIMGSTIAIFFPGSEMKPSPPASAKSRDEKTDQTTEEKKQKQHQQKQQQTPPTQELAPLVRSLVADSCDILIPGSFVGWIQASPTQVGIAMIVSTVLSSWDIWVKINA